jgi:hypothetical protein
MYYLTSVSAIKEEVRKRWKSRNLIRALLDEHIKEDFGINDFSGLFTSGILRSVTDPFTASQPETVYGVLARQVPGVCIEDVACYMLSLRLGLQPLTLAFTRDTFHSGSNDKLFRVKVPFSSWSKKGNLQVAHKSVVTNTNGHSYTDLDMMRMDRFLVGDCTLAEYHRRMQNVVFTQSEIPCLWGDISRTWGDILALSREANKHPATVWKNNADGKDIKWSDEYSVDDARSLIVRPSSKWYYHLYLSMFLDGTFVLLETYDNESGGVPAARSLFETEMNAIKQATGYMPLVVKTAPLRPDMLYVNQHIIDNPAAIQHLTALRSRYWSDDTALMTRWFADQVIQFRD